MLSDMLADVQAPFPLPIGLRLAQAARAVERAFDEVLGEAGGTLPVWLILLNLKVRKPANQRELAEAVGVREATLTHHLNAMDARGLVTRTRDAANRRVQVVALTEVPNEPTCLPRSGPLRCREDGHARDMTLSWKVVIDCADPHAQALSVPPRSATWWRATACSSSGC